MNIKRPSIIFAISAILGVILAYNKIEIIDKIIIFSIIFLLFSFMLFKKKLSIYMIFVCLMCIAIFGIRFKYMRKYFDDLDFYIENNVDKNDILIGEICAIGESSNSKYIDLINVHHNDKNIGKIKCYYDKEKILDIKIGYKVSFSGKMYRFERAMNVGQFDNQNYYRSLGFTQSIYTKDIIIFEKNVHKLKQFLYEVRLKIKSNIYQIFTQKNAGLFNCMLTGDKSGLDKLQKKLFNENGIAHILAISGLHLSILGIGFFEILRKKLKLRLSAFIVSIFIFLYGLFIDCSVSSIRAIIMLYVRFFALAIGRTYDSRNTLYILIFIFLLCNPYNLFNAGFQFSYMSIMALNMEFKFKSKKISNIRNEIKDWISLTEEKRKTSYIVKVPSVIILTIFLLPITIYNYFTYPTYSILLNLIVIPLMTFVMFFGLIGVMVSFISIPLARFIVGIVHMIFLLYEKLCYFVETLPLHKILFGRPNIKSIIIFYTIFFIIYGICIFINDYDNIIEMTYNHFIQKSRIMKINNVLLKKNIDYLKLKCKNMNNDSGEILKKIEERIVQFNIYKKIIYTNILLVMFVIIFILSIQIQKGLKISGLYVGQGDSFVIRTEDKKVFTIDGGSSSNTSNGQYVLHPNFMANKISIIEKAYISHIDQDHLNGIKYIIEEDKDIIIKEVVLPIVAKFNNKYEEFVDFLNVNNIKITYLKRGDIDIIDKNLFFKCISPNDDKLDKLNYDINQSSLCLQLYYKGKDDEKSMLFTGDMGQEMEKEVLKDITVKDYLKCDILKIGHHGSRTSSFSKFVSTVNPTYGILSYGYKNSYNHPHKNTLKTLEKYNVTTYNTVDRGEIDIYINDDIKFDFYLK